MLVRDLGFGELVAASGASLPSVITFRLRNMPPDRVNGALHSILSQHGEAFEHGAMSVRGPSAGAVSSAQSLKRGYCCESRCGVKRYTESGNIIIGRICLAWYWPILSSAILAHSAYFMFGC